VTSRRTEAKKANRWPYWSRRVSDGQTSAAAAVATQWDLARTYIHKVALFDDTTSEALRKNRATGREWGLVPPFDLADFAGTGEGGFKYFYDQQWKRFFATVPDRYRLKVNGRPVVFMWHGGHAWYTNQSMFGALIRELRAATQRDFGVDPFVIPEEDWLKLDANYRPDAIYDWFEPAVAA